METDKREWEGDMENILPSSANLKSIIYQLISRIEDAALERGAQRAVEYIQDNAIPLVGVNNEPVRRDLAQFIVLPNVLEGALIRARSNSKV